MFATRSRIPRCNSSSLASGTAARLPRFHIRAATRSNSSSSSSSSSAASSLKLKTPNPLPRLVLFATLGGLAGVLVASTLSPSKASQLVEGSPTFNHNYASPSEAKKAIEELKGIFSDKGRVLTDQETLETYGYSPNSYHHAAPHSVVVRVLSTEDVVKVVNVARKWRMPITAYSGGTSLEGHFGGYDHKGAPGGICVDLSGMNKVIRVDEEDCDMIVQTGIKWEDVNQILADKNIPLFFPLDPGPGATIGGMISTGCSGTNAVKYGTAKGEWFLNITVVLPSGEVIKTRRRARKSSAGFDTTKLFIGAEGTLGIVTEATLRLAPKLPTSVAVAQFPDVATAVSAVTEVLKSPMGAHVQCVELMDNHMMQAINHSGLSAKAFPEVDSLFFKFQGTTASISETSKIIKSIVNKYGCTKFQAARSAEEAEELWNHRKIALWSTLGWPDDADARVWTTDVCVPPSKLPQLVKETKEDMAESKLLSTIVGHVGDGNFHAFMIFRNDEELEVVRGAVHRLVHRALALDGTCTGEHGIGVGKKEYLVEELGEGTVALMRQIKKAIDPLNLFNPGKLYPDEGDGQKKH